MSNAGLQGIDARLMSGFKRQGTADGGATFKSLGISVPNCDVYVDRGVQLFGDQTQVTNDQITITGFLVQLGKVPARGDTFSVGTEVFIVDSISHKDESKVVCIVTEAL